MKGQTLLDLIVRYPRVAAAMAVFAAFGILSGRAEFGVVAAVIVYFQVKKGALDFLSPDPSGYIDRSVDADGTRPDERPPEERYEFLPRYGDRGAEDLQPMGALEEDEEVAVLVAEPEVRPTSRPASSSTYGIAVPERKPVDVPRRR